ncbi:hypothetical protein HNY73_005673 [Argiope bruennichi]|uniref:Ig-like domain-containing protein n=1 Tax=Argiope bruennichi TaxID=94029 RepID=A0A8T0FIA5_ARGBR|nr:hypothetical protein HNY73_005673 [Argiope bruennichi]
MRLSIVPSVQEAPGESVCSGYCVHTTPTRFPFWCNIICIKRNKNLIQAPQVFFHYTHHDTMGDTHIHHLTSLVTNWKRKCILKWYKNDVEFYRYVPNDWPPGQFLPLPGIRVDLSKSNKNSVYLRHVDLNSSGIYRCEISAEAPSFDTAEAEKEMKVFVLPSEGPTLTGGNQEYRIGDTVVVNCTSAKSKPAATLRWYINDELITKENNAPTTNPRVAASNMLKSENLKKVDFTQFNAEVGPEYETEYSTTRHADGLETSSLGLKFVVTSKHFQNGNMKLKCTATISRIYTMSNEEMVFGGRQQTSGLHISENMSRMRDSATQNPAVRWTVALLASCCLLLYKS